MTRRWLLAALFVLDFPVGAGPAVGSSSGIGGGRACGGANGKIAAIRTERGGDELGLLDEGRFIRLYKVPLEEG